MQGEAFDENLSHREKAQISDLWNSGYDWVGDFNGDGLADIASAIGAQVFIKFSTGTGFTQAVYNVPAIWAGTNFTQEEYDVPGNWGTAWYWTWAGDFNGDGRTDLLTAQDSAAFFKFKTDTGFNQVEALRPGINWGSDGRSWAGDFDGDGRDEIARATSGHVQIAYSDEIGH
jgi:hypothetical protein